jgi:hypothetical protein
VLPISLLPLHYWASLCFFSGADDLFFPVPTTCRQQRSLVAVQLSPGLPKGSALETPAVWLMNRTLSLRFLLWFRGLVALYRSGYPSRDIGGACDIVVSYSLHILTLTVCYVAENLQTTLPYLEFWLWGLLTCYDLCLVWP